ncbi:MAG: hypothetical protein OXC92_06875 [Flavobacteriaceae bacterium]|nr:hypothetical protein [Flavobacteriaceae bacterium]
MRNNQKTAPMQTMKPLGSRREKNDDGYKQHIATTRKSFTLGRYTAVANEHDRQGYNSTESLSVEERKRILADKDDQSKKMIEYMGSESFATSP